MDGSGDATESSKGFISGLAKAVSVVSPVLASALTGHAGGVVLALIEGIFGLGGDNGTDLLARIAGDPEAEYKLRKLESDHSEFLASLDSRDYAVGAEDRADARRNSGNYKSFIMTMAFVVTAGFFGILLLLFIPLDISDEGKNLLSMLVGMLASKWQTIIDFFFGSSHSSEVRKLPLT